jgi:hypothetical protein
VTSKPNLLPIDIGYIIKKVKGKLDDAEATHEEATSSLDELISLGRKEAFGEVMSLLYALKKVSSDEQSDAAEEIWTNEDESAEIERQIIEDARR